MQTQGSGPEQRPDQGRVVAPRVARNTVGGWETAPAVPRPCPGRALAVPGLKPGGWGPAPGRNSLSPRRQHTGPGCSRLSVPGVCPPLPQALTSHLAKGPVLSLKEGLCARAAWLLTKGPQRALKMGKDLTTTSDGARQVAPRSGPCAVRVRSGPQLRGASQAVSQPQLLPEAAPAAGTALGVHLVPGAGSGRARRPHPPAPALAAAPARPPG